MERLKKEIIKELNKNGRLSLMKSHYQHGNTSVYEHSLKVADTSLRIAKILRLKIDNYSLIRGALLHDYFLYDWHEKDKCHRWHGFKHPKTSYYNASNDYQLNDKEKNIIIRHMFPLTPIPPFYKESWIVCLADKYCALKETLAPLLTKIN